jgi:hypothetical protein
MGDTLRAAVLLFILGASARACGVPQALPPDNPSSSQTLARRPTELIEQADEDRRLTYIESRISLGYRFDEFYHPRTVTPPASVGFSLSDRRVGSRRASNCLL